VTYSDAIDTNSSQMVPRAQSKLDIALSLKKLRGRDAARTEPSIMYLSHNWADSCDCDLQSKPRKKISCHFGFIVTYYDTMDTNSSQMMPRAKASWILPRGRSIKASSLQQFSYM